MNGDDTRQAAALARHIKAALLHLRQAEDIAAAAAGIDIDGGNDTARLIRAAGEATEDLDLWAVNNARDHGAAPGETYQHTERWCHAPGGQLPEGSWPAQREPDGPEGGLAGPATGPEQDQLIEEFANEYPEVSPGETAQQEFDREGHTEGPGLTEPPLHWIGGHSGHEREHYWDTPEHEIPSRAATG